MKNLSKAVAMFLLFTLTASAAGPVHTGVSLPLRTQVQPFHADSPWVEANFSETIVPSETAIIITDMWDRHWCSGATKRVGEIAVRMEPVLEKARSAGVLIIHAPSTTMSFYEGTPGRQLAKDAPVVPHPPEIAMEKMPLPIEDPDGGCDTPGDKYFKAWTRETKALTIAKGDVISDDGAEIFNVLQQHHIKTVLYMGVHANICILNRTFGIRNMTKWGVRCVLVRDLTDAMYKSADRPYVSHAAGTELVVEYIEKYLAPTTTSHELLTALAQTKAGTHP